MARRGPGKRPVLAYSISSFRIGKRRRSLGEAERGTYLGGFIRKNQWGGRGPGYGDEKRRYPKRGKFLLGGMTGARRL